MIADAAARARIEDALDTTLFVEAAAGTGKTTALVSRIVSVLRSGAGALDRVVAVTFTEKAAGELKLRLREQIEVARSTAPPGSPARQNLDAALETLEAARIGTIHGFCGDLLRERPVEAGVDPLFEIAPEEQSQQLLDRAFDAWFQQVLADPPEGVRRVLRRRPRGFGALGPRQQLRNAAGQLVEHRDFRTPWRRDPFDREAEIDRVMDALGELAAYADEATRPDDWLARNFENIGHFTRETRLREGVRGRDHDALESELRDLALNRRIGWHWRGRGAYSAEHGRDELIARRDAVKAELGELVERCNADLAPLLHAELRPVVERYEQLKQRAGVLDFLDLLLRARDLVRDHAEVRRELQRRFSHFFVDEFQDTDPLQAELLLLLAADDPDCDAHTSAVPAPGKLFLVGDPKQAIYRFRRADVATYEAVKRQLLGCGAQVVHLTTSFRAVPSLQQAINAAFEPVMGGPEKGEELQPHYVPLQPSRPEAAAQPSLIALPAPRPYGDYGSIVQWRIDDSLADAVGAFVDWLVSRSGWTVEEAGERVPVSARHVCLLLRRFKNFRDDVTRPYVRALEARRVPHVLVGGHSFHDREEVLALRNALCAIEWPEDELRVFATLRGPLFALGDDALLAFRHKTHSLHPLQLRESFAFSDAEAEVAEALDILARLHVRRNRAPCADTVSRLLAAVRAHAGIAIWPTGEQALANCLRIVDMARRFERRGAISFRAFVEGLEDSAERGDAQEAPVVEEGTEGVRIMTAHRAKGLEFPVVVLADPNCNAIRPLPQRYVDAARNLWAETLCGCAPADLLEQRDAELASDRAEAIRVAYVAATRARDLLVVPVVGDPYERDREGWIDVLDPAVHPLPAERRNARSAPGCPPFGSDSVVERPSNARSGPRSSVAPGLHAPKAGPHTVVWWDPAALDLDREEEVGLRQQRILEADEAGVCADESIRAHDQWQRRRAEMLAAGERPSRVVHPITRIAEQGATGDGSDVRLERVDAERAARPGGRRFGTLVHATLAVVDYRANAADVEAAAAAEARLLGATRAEIDAAVAAVRAALAHPLLVRAANADALRRETPVISKREDGSLAEGVVDLAFRETADGAPRWTVVDFKTDADPDANRARHAAQVRLYADAIARATGEPVEPVLLAV